MTTKTTPARDIDVTGEANPVSAFTQAVNKAAPGTKIIYHRGNAITGSAIARKVRASYVSGLVELVQRRVREGRDAGVFEYIAIRTGPQTAG